MKIKNHLKINEPIASFFPDMSDSFKAKLPLFEKMLETGLVPEELYSTFKEDTFNRNFMESFSLLSLRDPHFKKFGFSLLNEKLVSTLALEFKNDKIIDAGAGTGWISHNLQKKGLDITPVELYTENNNYQFNTYHTKIINMSAEKYMLNNSYDTILLSWPNYDTDFAASILDLMPKGKKLIYVGEGYGGCTANDRFFDLLDNKCTLDTKTTDRLQKHSQRWAGIHDDWYVYKVND